jgi:hypothetical protein
MRYSFLLIYESGFLDYHTFSNRLEPRDSTKWLSTSEVSTPVHVAQKDYFGILRYKKCHLGFALLGLGRLWIALVKLLDV